MRPADAGARRRGIPEGTPIAHARGCVACGRTGYRGRLAIAEVLVSDPNVERRIAAGETSLGELLRVAEPPAGPPTGGTPGTAGTARYIADAPASRPRPGAAGLGDASVTDIAAGTVDAYVIRPMPEGWRVLVLQRAADTRCPGAWEAVHGRLEPGESAEDGVIREIWEETGLAPERLYVITVQPYYLKSTATVQLAVVFAAFVADAADVTLGPEHRAFDWLDVDGAAARFAWPRERAALGEIVSLLGGGDAGAVEDVLRVR